ncbi:membrane-spanning 4-domains subfamily A member 4A-like [Sinocyclocheilus grahami]|uniref:membrane-spanning 4-domains subfamily A member 4A-like n=1 Tax=Sinocyclocheilus grahami TaxID=75366 RepID=UPI0007ACDD5B|nr:PREDICTED: membrane-spanning 4-domains subfamily A member 4A-like [Sinocyclocheilus grahami]
MENSKVIASDKATVIIQVNPQVAQDTVICDDGQQVRGAYHNTALKGFFKAQPKALGTVQILTGVMVFLLGIVLSGSLVRFGSISVFSGITYWGSFIYISTGSLSVAAQNKLHPCVVKASLGMNVISAITAAISIFLLGIEIGTSPRSHQNCNYASYNNYDCIQSQVYYLGITGILLVFSILQFIISIFISGFACKATCDTDSTVVNVALN